MRSGTEVNINVKPGELLTVRCNGALVADINGGPFDTRDDLEQRLVLDNVARNILGILDGMKRDIKYCVNKPDHVNTTTNARQKAWCDGLADGLEQKTLPHPDRGVPPTRPRSDGSYERGYEYGEAVARAMRMIGELVSQELKDNA